MSDVFPLSGYQGCHLIPLSYLLSFFCLSFHSFGLVICECANLMLKYRTTTCHFPRTLFTHILIQVNTRVAVQSMYCDM